GVSAARILSELEEESSPCHEQFDLVAGTSTGGFIAAAVATQSDLSAVHDTYRFYGDAFLKDRGMTLNALYPVERSAAFDTSLTAYIGERKLRDVAPDILIPALALKEAKATVFTSRKAKADTSDLLLKDAVLATSAAPMYLPPHEAEWGGETSEYVDGGLFANNPALLAYLEAKRLADGREIRILSVGTGRSGAQSLKDSVWDKMYNLRRRSDPTTRLYNAMIFSNLPHLLMEGGSSAVNQTLEDELGPRFMRLEPQFDGDVPPLAATSEKERGSMTELGFQTWQTHRTSVLSFLNPRA
ncbi:MAG: patatin-like phospholipase family protein, partial [Actinomycetes bacterium]